MSEDLPDFLGGEPASASTPAPEPAAPPAPAGNPPEPAPAPPAPLAPEAAPAAPPAAPEAHSVPLATFLDLRDKHSAAEREARELRAWRQQQEAAARRQPVPDRTEDPDGYEAHRAAQVQSELYNQRLDTSRAIAEMKHGPEVTKAAFEWGVQRCDQDQFFNEKVRNSRDPVGVVLEEWKREQLLSQLRPEDIQGYQQWKATQAGAPQPGSTPPAAPPAAPVAPRPSLAAGPSAGSSAAPEARDGEAQFGAMFGT